MSTVAPARARPRTAPAAHRTDGGDHRAALAAAGACAALGAALALLLPAGPARLPLVLLFDLIGPGAALLSHIRVRDALVAWALTVTASLSLVALPATVMLWRGEWRPLAAHAVLVAGTLVACAGRLVRARHHRPQRWTARLDAAGARHPARWWRDAGGLTPPLLVAGGLALWAVAVGTISAADVGPSGLTAALGPPFALAVLAVCAAFAAELFTRARPAVLAAGVVAITVLLRASAPLLLAQVQYPWTYKHFGVVEVIREAGRVVSPDDIYQQWPAFFAAAAHLSDVSGVPPIAYAAWSSLLFGLIDALLLAAVVRVVLDARRARTATPDGVNAVAGVADRRIMFLTVFLFTACLWVDTNYFSPQAFAFALVLGLMILVLGWLHRDTRGPGGHPPDAPTAINPARALRHRRRADRLRRAAALSAALAVFFVITAAHQLSPYIVLAGIGVLAVLGHVRPRVAVVLMCAVALGYFVPRMGGVTGEYGLFSGLNLWRNASGNAASWGSDAQRVSALIARGLALGVWATALLALWRRRRAPLSLSIGVLAFSPFGILALQSYGGEAIYRVFLFSLPWCALAIALWLAGAVNRRGVAIAVTTVALTVCGLAAHQGLQGQFMINTVPSGDVAAARVFYARAPQGATLLLAAQDFPARLTANYGRYGLGVPVEPALTDDERFRGDVLDATRLPEIERWAAGHAGTATYLAVSAQMAAHAEYFGDLPAGSLTALEAAVRASPRWTVFHEATGITIFQLRSSG